MEWMEHGKCFFVSSIFLWKIGSLLYSSTFSFSHGLLRSQLAMDQSNTSLSDIITLDIVTLDVLTLNI